MAGLFGKWFGVPTVKSPKLGILDLSKGAAAGVVAADQKMLTPLFGEASTSSGLPPQCDVLFIYGTLDVDGKLVGASAGLRGTIQDSGARVVVIATANSAERYIAASKEGRSGRANLVMTLNRNGEAFGLFFSRLFGEMKRGVSMPVAWVRLAPQAPNIEHPECPDTIFACEAGQLAFG